MKFVCLQENLLKGLQAVSKAVSVKPPIPVLNNVLLTSDDGMLKLSATDLNITITTHVGASINEEGTICVPAKLFLEVINTLPSGNISCEIEGAHLVIKTGKVSTKISTVVAKDFPELPTISEELPFVSLAPKVLADALSVVYFSAAIDSSRPILTGIYSIFKNNKIEFVSVDGFRLSEKIVDCVSELEEEFAVVIPAKNLFEVSRIFSNSTEPIKIAYNQEDNLMLFESSGIFVASGILDGDFPDYKRIIPSEKIITSTFLSEELLGAIKLCNVFSKDTTNIVIFNFNDDGTIKISSSSDETGEALSTIDAKVEGTPYEVAYNAKYLTDFFSNVKSTTVIFESKGEYSPGVFRAEGLEDYIHIIIPSRL